MDTSSEISPEVLDSIEKQFEKDTEHDTPSDPLFHYTSPRGFLGIIDKREIWATHYRFLNDRDELRIGEEAVLQEAQSLLKELKPNTAEHFIIEQFVRIYPKARLTEVTNIYLASLSENGDQLSQWRSYGSDGAGYSIGVRSIPLPTKDMTGGQAGLILMKCEYDPKPFAAQARKTLLDVARVFDHTVRNHVGSEGQLRAARNAALSAGYRRIAVEIPRLKHAAFREEQEWRLVIVPSLEREKEIVRHRTTSRGVTPYVEVSLARKDEQIDLSRVYVGPGDDRELTIKTTKDLLRYRGYEAQGLVVASSAPYRGTGGA
jgi:hypothetical protein